MKSFIVFFYFIICSTNLTVAQTADDNMLKSVMERFQCSRSEAEDFLMFLGEQLYYMQNSISRIASSETSRSEKTSRIDVMIEKFFEDPYKSVVQVSSAHRPHIEEIPVIDYLNRIANLWKRYRYVHVDLSFDPDYFQLGQIAKTGHSSYEFNVMVQQYFIGCRDEEKTNCYKDTTFKAFRFIFEADSNGIYHLRLKSIRVVQTLRGIK